MLPSGHVGEALFEVGDDVAGLIHPARACCIVDAQARHLHFAAACLQLRARFGIAFGVAQRDGRVQFVNGAPRLDAERAGVDW